MKHILSPLSFILFLYLAFITNNCQAQWVQMPGLGTVLSFAVKGNDLYAGTNSGVYRSTNLGSNWTAVNNGLTAQYIYALSTDGTNLFAGSDKVFISTDNGGNWSAASNGMTCSYVQALLISGSNIFAGTYGGGAYLSTNNGANWTAINNGIGSVYVNTLALSGTNLFSGNGPAAGSGGGVYKSTNNGASWISVNNGVPGNAGIKTLLATGTNIYAGDNTNGIYMTTNNGANWTAVNNGITGYNLYIYSLANFGTSAFVGTAYSIFQTTNNGGNWVQVSQGFSYLTTRAFAFINDYIFAGTNSSVYRRDLSELIKPNAPLLVNPANNSISMPFNLNLQWAKPRFGSGYDVLLATDSAFTNVILNDSALTDTSRSLSNLSPITDYYWKVRAKSLAGWGSFSDAWKFTTIVPIPTAPALFSPANNSSDIPISLNLVWNKPQYANTYRIQLATDSLFGALVINDSTLADSIRTVTGLSNSTNYWWRVNAKNVGGTGSYSAASKFTTIIAAPSAPALLSPANNSTGVPVLSTLIWNKTPTAISYRVQLSSDSLFNSLIINDSTITDSTRIVSGLSNLANYWWRVNAKNVGGISAYSSAFKFTTIIAAPSAPVLLSPANNSTGVPVLSTLIWNKTPTAISYRVQLSSDSLFNSLIINDSTITDSTRIVSGLSNLANYWWRVNAKNVGGISAYSTAFKFTTIMAAPSAPSLVTPPNNSVGNLTTLMLAWSRSANAATYRIQLSTDSLFNTIVVNDSTLTDSTRAVSGLNPLTYYWWRVSAKNAGGTSAFSSAFKFKTLGVPTQITGIFVPANCAVNQPTTINFMWSRAFDQTLNKTLNLHGKFNSQSISNYWFELTTDSVSLAGIIRDSLLTDTIKTQGGFNYSTSYYWRVKAKNQIGWGAFSFWQKFTTAPPPPATVTLKVIPGGFYDPLCGALRMRDTIRVYLVDSATCLRLDSNKVVLDSITFTTSLSFSNAPTGNYYLYVYQRNHLPVASMYRQNIIRGSNVSYDLTTDSSKAFGFNMIKVSNSPVRWGLIPGDANRDEFIDGLDQTIWINQNGFDGYLDADFNGDMFVDGLDQTIWIMYNGNSSYLPCMTPSLNIGPEKQKIQIEKQNYIYRKK